MLYIGEDESFEMSAYVDSPGFQSIVLSGYLVSERADGTYVARLQPGLFYGANGQPLQHSWRQYIPQAGSQVILRKPAGHPMIPKEDLGWRKVASRGQTQQVQVQQTELPPWMGTLAIGIISSIIGGLIIYYMVKKQ